VVVVIVDIGVAIWRIWGAIFHLPCSRIEVRIAERERERERRSFGYRNDRSIIVTKFA